MSAMKFYEKTRAQTAKDRYGVYFIMREKTCCFTGHRIIAKAKREELKRKIENTVCELFLTKGVDTFIAGGALGFDTIAAQAVLDVREKFPDVKLKLYFPCKDQCKGWRAEEAELYEEIKAQADEFLYVSEEYIKGCMHLRNRKLVDDSAFCICYSKREIGGTAYTVKYAEKSEIEIINLA